VTTGRAAFVRRHVLAREVSATPTPVEPDVGLAFRAAMHQAIMLKICELVEGFLPESDKVMPAIVTHQVNDVYLAVSRAMNLPPATSWLDD
jgi:hypothetical protein